MPYFTIHEELTFAVEADDAKAALAEFEAKRNGYIPDGRDVYVTDEFGEDVRDD